MDIPLPPAEELALIDRELAQLDARRTWLLGRRAWLLSLLQAPSAAAPPAPAVPGQPWAPPGPRRDASAPGAQNVLLTLGAVLLAVAALAFTLVSWGSMGIGGRATVLAVVTAAALGAPAVLLRRGLRSTAESVGGVAMVLTVLDAYAVYAVGLPGTDGTAYAAGAAAVLAAVWAAYGLVLPGLRTPLPAAVFAAQLPLPLAALAAAAGVTGTGWALLLTAALDAGLALWSRPGAVARWCAGVSGAVLGTGVLLTGLAESAGSRAGLDAAAPGALLAALAGCCLAVAWRAAGGSAAGGVGRVAGYGLAAAGGFAAVGAVGGVLRPPLDSEWLPVVFLAVALPLTAAVRAAGWPAPVRRGLAAAGAAAAALPVVLVLPAVVAAVGAPLGVLDEVWEASAPAGSPLWPGAAVPVVLLPAAAAAGWLGRVLRRPEPGVVAVLLGWAGLFTAPVAAGLPAGAVPAVQVAVVIAALGAALRWTGRAGMRAAGAAVACCAAVGAVAVSVAALDGRTATFAVFGVLGAACAAGAAYGPAPAWLRACSAVAAVGYATALLAALGALLELPVHRWGLLVLAVPAAVAVRPPGRAGGPVPRVPVELAAAGAGLLAVVLAAGDPAWLALLLALAGVVCAGAAVRADRRRVGYAAGALFVAATWVRLAASGVAVPEAYTLPVTVPALAVGLLRRRRDPEAPSWTAYGPGLAATLLPSLVAAWGDPHWLRPLLLGLGALGVTLVGAHRRLQAPLVLGGAVLALDALHELTPYVVQVVDALPRWLPPALAGLLLLAVGATYEKRLRDARRLRDALGRLG
ncbi:SCO7613 C-terminal domain-containing membrane protein [Streptomyces sp. NPDC048603]|uniref:SCO7613 C-terminal domain-containing membrane protein n=1 Tax=Streptomyces sp. NPDC048603 TaxID=3365577 RepID=UPI0037169685